MPGDALAATEAGSCAWLTATGQPASALSTSSTTPPTKAPTMYNRVLPTGFVGRGRPACADIAFHDAR